MQELLTLNGNFWLPEEPNIKLTGQLSFDTETGIRLELLGCFDHFENHNRPSKHILINGITSDGKEISLFKNYTINRKWNSNGLHTSILRSDFMFLGGIISCESELFFNKIVLKVKNLDEWLGISGFEINHQPSDDSTNITFNRPSKIEFNLLTNYKASFNFLLGNLLMESYQKNISLNQKVQFVLESRNGELYHFQQLLKDSFVLSSFLTLATFSASYPLSIEFYSPAYYWEFDDKKIPKEITLLYRPSIIKQEKEVPKYDMLFTYDDIKNEFEHIINKIYSTNEKLESVIGLFIEDIYRPGTFNENRFLNIAHALEIYHRRFINNKVLPEVEHKERLKRIINSVPDIDAEWLNQKLLFSNEPSLKERIEDLLTHYSNETLNKIIKDNSEFIKKVKDSRNYYTHYDYKLRPKALKGGELFYLTERMKVLLVCCILHTINFEKTKIEHLLKRNEYKFYNHLL